MVSKIRVAAGDQSLFLSSSDSMVKKSGLFDATYASSEAHDTYDPVVHAINIRARCMVIIK